MPTMDMWVLQQVISRPLYSVMRPDADYGYVGAAAGRITLYKGREIVERNIPQEEAIDHLIALIKANGDWQDAE